MKVVEIESRYEQVAAERDKLRHELEAYKEGNIKQQEEYQRHVDEDRVKCERLVAENNRLSKDLAQLKISNMKMQDEVKRIEAEFAEKLRAQQQAEVQVKKTVTDLCT